MRVNVALLADYSNVSREGKLNILGIFDTLYAPSFPTVHPHMQLVIRFEAESDEVGTTHEIEVQFGAEGEESLFRLPGAMTIQRGEHGQAVRGDHIITLTNMRFEKAGRYAFTILIDGRLDATLPLRVEQITSRH